MILKLNFSTEKHLFELGQRCQQHITPINTKIYTFITIIQDFIVCEWVIAIICFLWQNDNSLQSVFDKLIKNIALFILL